MMVDRLFGNACRQFYKLVEEAAGLATSAATAWQTRRLRLTVVVEAREGARDRC